MEEFFHHEAVRRKMDFTGRWMEDVENSNKRSSCGSDAEIGQTWMASISAKLGPCPNFHSYLTIVLAIVNRYQLV